MVRINIKLLWYRVLNWDIIGIFGYYYLLEKEYCLSYGLLI